MVNKLACFLCQDDLRKRAEESWCYGCKHYICEMHDTIFGKHTPEEHDGEDANE